MDGVVSLGRPEPRPAQDEVLSLPKPVSEKPTSQDLANNTHVKSFSCLLRSPHLDCPDD
jgi:hypothetical protein